MAGYQDLALLTDLYQLTMAQSYFDHKMFDAATFSLFIRKYPPDRAYFVAAGVEDVLAFVEQVRFSEQDLAYLESLGSFSSAFLNYLRGLHFTGEVRAIPEGRLFFVNEPVLEVTAPIIEAQIIETFIINQMNLQSIIATKASRCVTAASGRTVVDFSLRRTHGIDAGMKVARTSYMAGLAATSNVLAGRCYGIPTTGTMAHSYVTAFEDELDAFSSFAATYPDRSVLLIDTYDTLAGARKAVQVARNMEARGHRLQGVRLDSGDLLELSRGVRRILDEAGLDYVSIFASGGLDEYKVEELVQAGAPIDGFGVGTKMGVSADAPWTDTAYKLVRYRGRPVLKLSQGKATLPDQKQVYRFHRPDGLMERDVIALRSEEIAGGEPLLEPVMVDGKRRREPPSLQELRDRCSEDSGRLPEVYRRLRPASEYPIELSRGLADLDRRLQKRDRQREG